MPKRFRQIFVILLFIFFIAAVSLRSALFEERNLPEKLIRFKIEDSDTLQSVSKRLEDNKIISSARLLRLYLSWQHFDTKLLQGEFHFISPISLRDVAHRLTQKPNKPLLIVTIPEGYDDDEIASAYVKKNTKLSKEKLLSAIAERNATGYLFPDTYFLSGNENEYQIIDRMLLNFRDKYVKNFEEGGGSELRSLQENKDLYKELILASILEGEANNENDMHIIAGILLAREKIGMRLQVDVATETYKQKGFPEKPINNPGLFALRAAKNPTKTSYLYYLTGKDGKMYYAKTFAEHRKNIINYLQ